MIALVGVIGSGKDYALNELRNEHRVFEIFDFSDAVREITYKFLGFRPADDNEYTIFKGTSHILKFMTKFGVVETEVTGRKFLENIGITMRGIDSDFWVNLCSKAASNHIVANQPNVVLFSAVRYPNEAKAIFKLAKTHKYDVKFIMTDFKSDRYEIRDDDSEKFAQELLRRGASHMDCVNDKVKQLINEYYGSTDWLSSRK